MKENEGKERKEGANRPNVFVAFKPYRMMISVLAVCVIIASGLGLVIPRLVARGIDTYAAGTLDMQALAIEFSAVAVGILLFTYGQSLFQTFLAEKVARELRDKMADRISSLSYVRLEQETPAKLLTNLTSDIDAIKMFASFGMSMTISSIVLIVGAAVLLFITNWKLALAVMALLPVIGVAFALVFKKLEPLFTGTQGVVDKLNAVISESVVGAALVRVFNARETERSKFKVVNTESLDMGMKILRYFSFLIPIIGIVANLAVLVILLLGGKFVIGGTMTIGEFTAFNGYVFILIFPIIMSGFVSSMLARAQASYGRIADVINLPPEVDHSTERGQIRGDIEARDVSIAYGDKRVLKNVSFAMRAGTKNAVIGPTAAGKTQLLYALMGLIVPTSGEVLYDGKPVKSYSREALHGQVALVFQDSVMFNLSLRGNIAFGAEVREAAEGDKVSEAVSASVQKAIETAELADFVRELPRGLDTNVSERGTSLSGGQKQRVMLARALALDPKVLFLDDFTARVDAATEAKILANIERNYPGITIVSVTQKVRSVEHFDQIVVLMEGEVVAAGTHASLRESSPEYAQIIESQKSTESYEKGYEN